MQRATLQALKFGARLSSPCHVAALETDHHYLRVVLTDGTGIDSRAVLIATGARYRKLSLASWERFEGAGIYYAATNLEAQLCAGRPVCVVGGANSAGQAALYLASRGCGVTLAVRGKDVASGMSSYLLDRLGRSKFVAQLLDVGICLIQFGFELCTTLVGRIEFGFEVSDDLL